VIVRARAALGKFIVQGVTRRASARSLHTSDPDTGLAMKILRCSLLLLVLSLAAGACGSSITGPHTPDSGNHTPDSGNHTPDSGNIG